MKKESPKRLGTTAVEALIAVTACLAVPLQLLYLDLGLGSWSIGLALGLGSMLGATYMILRSRN